MPASIVSFVPGPAHVRRPVLDAMAAPPLPHRSDEMVALVQRVQSGLATVLGTRAATFPVLASGTMSLEVALRGVGRRRALVLSGGAFGERLLRVCAGIGLATEHLAVPSGWPVDAEVLHRALTAQDFDTVALVHCETQTGALTDLLAIGDVVRAHAGVALVVDAVSSYAGVEIPFDDLGPETVMVSASGKALACPPGVSVMAVSDAAAERARGATGDGYALRLESLVKRARDGQTPQTPSTPLLYALDVQLRAVLAEGMQARAARHTEMAGLVHAWADGRFEVLAREDARSPTVTTLENTRGIDIAALLAAAVERGFRIADGYGELKGASFRIGHMGDVTPADTRALLEALDEALIGL
jgi:aspartate aminotransferase-like enzyme